MTGRLLLLLLFLPGSLVSTRSFFLGTAKEEDKRRSLPEHERKRNWKRNFPEEKGRCVVGIAL